MAIWQSIAELKHINPQNPVGPDVLKAMNALELVALCCEAGIIDPDIVRRTFRQTYVELYDQIDQVANVPGLSKTGKKLITENPAAMKLYQTFKQEIMDQGSMKKL